MEEIILILENKYGIFKKMNTTMNKVCKILSTNTDIKSWQVINRYANTKHDLIKTIDREYRHMKERGWDRIFFFFDLHGTVIKPNFEVGNVELNYYPYARETLLLLTDKSSPESIKFHLQMSKKSFKRAIGNLFKQKLIALKADRIEIIKKG